MTTSIAARRACLAILVFGFLPIALGIAILRYRLFEIDRLISRSIADALLTGGLLVTFLVVNLALTTAFSSITNADSVSVAATTLFVAAMFTTTRFAERLRHEVDIGAVAGGLDATVRGALMPTVIGLWLRAGDR